MLVQEEAAERGPALLGLVGVQEAEVEELVLELEQVVGLVAEVGELVGVVGEVEAAVLAAAPVAELVEEAQS